METMFIVCYIRHVKTDDSWDYKMIGRYGTKSEALKAYHKKLSDDIDSSSLDNVSVYILDNFGNKIESSSWVEEVTTKPQAE